MDTITERPHTTLEVTVPWLANRRLENYWLVRTDRAEGYVNWLGGWFDNLGSHRTETPTIGSDVRTLLNPPVRVGQVVLALGTSGWRHDQRPYLAVVDFAEAGGGNISVKPVNEEDVQPGLRGASIWVTHWVLMDAAVQAAYGSPAEDVTEPAPEVDGQQRVRDLLRILHREAIEHGYRSDWDELQEWFEETFGVSVDEFAGSTYTVSGKWSAWLSTETRRLRFDGHIPHGTRLVSLGPVNSEGRGTGEMADRVAQALLKTLGEGNGFESAAGYPTEMTFEPVPTSNVGTLGDHDPDDVFEQVLDWAGEHAVEQDWCKQFEEIMGKHGLDARRCSKTYDVTVEVDLERTFNWSDIPSDKEDDLALLLGVAAVTYATVEAQFSQTVTITTATPDNIGEQEVRDQLRDLDVEFDSITDYREVEREEADV